MASILVVDDADIIRFQLKMILEKAGHTVVDEAENGQEAFDKYCAFKPDLVTMDITMPEVDGLMGLKKIREFDPEAKVIMITALGQKALVVEAVKNGAKDYIVKPFQTEKVISSIERVLSL